MLLLKMQLNTTGSNNIKAMSSEGRPGYRAADPDGPSGDAGPGQRGFASPSRRRRTTMEPSLLDVSSCLTRKQKSKLPFSCPVAWTLFLILGHKHSISPEFPKTSTVRFVS